MKPKQDNIVLLEPEKNGPRESEKVIQMIINITPHLFRKSLSVILVILFPSQLFALFPLTFGKVITAIVQM